MENGLKVVRAPEAGSILKTVTGISDDVPISRNFRSAVHGSGASPAACSEPEEVRGEGHGLKVIG
jgi:hypothetical protein